MGWHSGVYQKSPSDDEHIQLSNIIGHKINTRDVVAFLHNSFNCAEEETRKTVIHISLPLPPAKKKFLE